MSSFYTPPNVRGDDKQIQYNENGVLSASSDLTWDDANKNFTVNGNLGISDVGIGTTFTTSLQLETPTADRVITIPNATGNVALVTGNTGYIPYNDGGANASDSGFTFSPITGLAVTTNIRVGVDTSTGVILKSPNGTEYMLFVDNSGVLGVTTNIS